MASGALPSRTLRTRLLLLSAASAPARPVDEECSRRDPAAAQMHDGVVKEGVGRVGKCRRNGVERRNHKVNGAAQAG
eukprot:2400001-Prymnesium_polylepis.2